MKLVCPYNSALIDRLENRSLCVRVKSQHEIVMAASDVKMRNNLSCVICDSTIPVEGIEAGEDWQDIPIALMAPSMGAFRNLSKKLELLKKLNLRVYLPCDKENLLSARLLASVGISTCVVLNADPAPFWDVLADLMTYALLGPVKHAPIEPFQTIAADYRQTSQWREDWERAYFDDPSQYLHIDEKGRIALSSRELAAGDVIADDLSALDSPEVNEAVDNRMEEWRKLFVENHFCARCKAWRICRGKFSKGRTEPDGCVEFFDEMADVIEQQRNKLKSNVPGQLWQL